MIKQTNDSLGEEGTYLPNFVIAHTGLKNQENVKLQEIQGMTGLHKRELNFHDNLIALLKKISSDSYLKKANIRINKFIYIKKKQILNEEEGSILQLSQ
jgi:hypothetical protein